MQPLEKGKEFIFFDTIRPRESIQLWIVERSAFRGPISLPDDWVSAPPLSATILLLQKTYKISWNMHQKAARWPTLLFIFLFMSSKDQKLMKTGCANLCSNAVIDRAAQRIEKDRCSETPTFVIGFSMSQHDRHLVACRLLSHLVHQSHNWEGGDSTSQAWLFLKTKNSYFIFYRPFTKPFDKLVCSGDSGSALRFIAVLLKKMCCTDSSSMGKSRNRF